MSVRKWLGLALLPLLASACNSHDNTVSDLSLPDVAGGVRSIRLSGDAAGNDGVAFTAASGAAYWVLGDDSNAAATVIYRRDRANAAWRRVPAEHGAMTLVTQGGADKGQFLDFLTSTLFNAPIYKNYGAMIVKETFEPAGFGASLAAKDMRLAGEAAGKLDVAMPLNDLLRSRLQRLIDGGEGHLDLTALSLLAQRDAAK